MSKEWLAVFAVPVFLICVYLVARFIFAAYFTTKQQFEERKHHGRKE